MPLRINWTRVPNGASIVQVGLLNSIDLMTSVMLQPPVYAPPHSNGPLHSRAIARTQTSRTRS